MDYINDIRRRAGIPESYDEPQYVIAEHHASAAAPFLSGGNARSVLRQIEELITRAERESHRTGEPVDIGSIVITAGNVQDYEG